MSWQERLLRVMAVLPLPVLRLIAWLIAQCLWWFAKKRRHIALRNLELCFPDLPISVREMYARDHFFVYVQSALDRSWLWFGSPQLILKRVHIDGLERLPTDGKYILLCPHFVGLDVAWTRVSMERQYASIYQPSKNPAVEALMRKGRGRFHDPLGIGKHEGVRKLVRYVKSGAPLFYLPDMDFGEKGSVFVPFFGVPAATLTSLSWFASEYDLPVYPIISTWDKQTGHYRLRVLPSWDGYPSGDEIENASFMNRQIESWVIDQPSQYLWVHKRFKTRPPGEDDLYKQEGA